MATAGGPKIIHDNDLVLALDGAAIRSTSRNLQQSNILPDSNNWTTGTGGQTGYGSNGSSSEQNRKQITDDPWGRTSIVWATTPDSTSGADGGWNSSHYTIDPEYTYRWSVWVRRYTAGTGGTFYLGLNVSPSEVLRNTSGATQSNPYFTYPAQSLLTQDQWYLVVYHVRPHWWSNTANHPDSGWYTNGKKITASPANNTGNMAGDGRFPSNATSARHRTYHYYTTNTSSGLEFCAPRIDKLDGTQPSIKQLLNLGESGWRNLRGKRSFTIPNGTSFTNYNKKGSFDLDGTDDTINLGDNADTDITGDITMELVLKADSMAGVPIHKDYQYSIQLSSTTFTYADSTNWSYASFGNHNHGMTAGNYYHIVATRSGNTVTMYVNGVSKVSKTFGSGGVTATANNAYIGSYNNSSNFFNGQIPVVRLYKKALSSTEINTNYNAYRGRFDLD